MEELSRYLFGDRGQVDSHSFGAYVGTSRVLLLLADCSRSAAGRCGRAFAYRTKTYNRSYQSSAMPEEGQKLDFLGIFDAIWTGLGTFQGPPTAPQASTWSPLVISARIKAGTNTLFNSTASFSMLQPSQIHYPISVIILCTKTILIRQPCDATVTRSQSSTTPSFIQNSRIVVAAL